MTLLSWFRPRRSSPRSASPRRPFRRTLLRLEALEDRCLPSTFAVTSADDNAAEHGTLRWAVANAVSGDTILITPAAVKNTPIVLTQGELLLTQSVTIKGVGNTAETISGGGNSRIFEVAAGTTVTLENLTLTGGNGVADNPGGTTSWDHNGGAVLNFGTTGVSGCTFVNNTTFDGGGQGGAVFNFGMMTLSACTVSHNSAYDTGGGLQNFLDATMTVVDSTVSDNFALLFGGGIINQGILTVSGSTFSGNSNNPNNGPFFGGGAIYSTTFESTTGVVTLIDCVFSGNGASDGGAVRLDGGTLTTTGCTFTGNTAVYTGGALEVGGAVTVSGSTFTGNSAGVAGGAILSAGVGALTVSGSTFSANSPDNIFGPYDGSGNTIS